MRFLSFIIVILLGAVSVFAQSPHGKELNIDCSSCHEATNWKVIPEKIKFDHNKQTSFELDGQHVTVSCQSCHKSLVFSKAKTNCISCHQDIHQNSLGPDCQSCHTPKTWIVSDIMQLHQNSRFPLTGVHANVDCQSCHSGYSRLYFPPQSVSCFSCHSKQYYATTSPNHAQSNFSTECQDCHSMTSFDWGATNIDHSFFPLVGGHNISNCYSCHKQGSNFKGLTSACYPCHKQNFEQAKNPDHIKAKFSTQCQDCHNINSFNNATFDHSTTGFVLTGAHATVSCQSCHSNGYTNTPTDCYSCHSSEFQKTTDPNHAAQGFPHDCTQCHSTTSWGGSSFDHSTTGFALTGAHTTVSCQSCHSNGYTNTPTDCYSCHSKDFQGTTDPNHVNQGFSHDCTQCHSTNSWGDASFDHSTTGFALTGVHATISCQSCHSNGYTNTPSDCYSCHSSDFQKATDPNHVAQGFPHDCTQCHSTNSWGDANFDHSTTGFALTGAHATVTCQSCHSNGYANTSTDCYSCHTSDFQKTTDPNHVAQGFPHDCTQCHSTASWGGSSFDHSTTGYTLTGTHSTITCQSCHSNGYTNTPSDCYSCHVSDFQKTNNPNHVNANFAHDCSQCHSTINWSNATFDHSTTGFALTGAHTTVSCQSCHSNGYTNTPADCYSCHSTQFQSTTNPNHVSQGFPHDCSQCHSTSNWNDATFDHSTTGFPLTGAHTSVSCQSCHSSGYTNTPADCYSCHQSNYDATTDPAHKAAGFPTACEQCHNTTSWQGATFDHDAAYFPIYSGRHAGRWNTCADCHTNSADYSVFSCITCHEHSQSNTDGHHGEVSNYVYNATSCYSCHRSGRGGD